MKDHLAKFIYNFKESEDMFIPQGIVYKPTEWMTKEGIMVDEPNTVDLLSFGSDDQFGKWMSQHNLKGFIELPNGCYEQIVKRFFKGIHLFEELNDFLSLCYWEGECM